MVWAGIMINGRTRLHVVANGTMTDQRYIDEVLLPHVCLFRGAVGYKFVFMDDNVCLLEATILSGKLQGEVVLLPQIPMILSDSPTHSNVFNSLFAWHLL
ncbi:hypothetical protein TNCV_2622531 [Trichonephila clavipes]|uniref:Uncharacterized protein n=1 Tax=Trichonephila clavipes TaxID=2585209 RepID=A0A8X7BHP3_TRICX|nr:hypothetical protein TNCV_2622531 [Trichonephila clavipes]